MSKFFSFNLFLVFTLLGTAFHGMAAGEPDLVSIQSVDKTIKVDLRYASARNIAGRPLYPPNMPALIRPEVARRLATAQALLKERGYGLKIWDAYRPKSAHDQLWQYSRNREYVADPASGGSLHTCGAAVDATLVDNKGRELPMPTDFDDFTMAAMLAYTGDNAEVRRNLHRLQNAMARAGFYGMRNEWWHFVTKDWKNYGPIPEVTIIARGRPGKEIPNATVTVPPGPLRPVSASSAGNSPQPAGRNRTVTQLSAGQ
ncbi:MAG: M15 family metallopeptidase [Chthoniobacterales bacterium]